MIGHVLYGALFVLNMSFSFLFIFFKCLSISGKRGRTFMRLAICIVFFEILEFILYYLTFVQGMNELYIICTITHGIMTFIFLGFVAVYADGYLPRNFLVTAFYCDFVTIIIGVLGLHDLPTLFITDDMNISSIVFDAHTPYDIILIIPYLISNVVIVIVAMLFNKKFTTLILKIPDRICLVFFSVYFFAYIGKCTYMCIYNTNTNDSDSPVALEAIIELNGLLVILMIAVLLLLLSLSQNRLRYQRLLLLENKLQYEYYSNVSHIHGEIRSLRHDLANHLAAVSAMGTLEPQRSLEYMNSLRTICNDIDTRIKGQTAWNNLNIDLLSGREKYEIYQYINAILLKYRLNAAQLCVRIDDEGNSSLISILLPKASSCRIRTSLLKRNPLYKLIGLIAAEHGGKAYWRRSEGIYGFYIQLEKE